MKLTLERLIDLAGPLSDSTKTNGASEKFRAMLREEFTDEDVEALLAEAKDGKGVYRYRAFQDLTNNFGERLGFCVQYGTYGWNTSPIPYDGL